MPFQHATLQNKSTGDPPVDVKFNPSEYSLARNMSYAEVQVPGLDTPLLQFVRGEAQTLSLELFLDASDRASQGKPQPGRPDPKGVDSDLAMLRAFVQIDPELHAPPVAEFKWGTLAFQGVVTNYTEKFVMFDPEGNALRARVTLQLKKFTPADVQLKETKRHSPDRTKTRVVRDGERIDAIAADEYGDASLWPAIARANRLARPRILAAGTLLVIPPL